MVFRQLGINHGEATLITSQVSAMYFTGYNNPDCCILITEDKSYYLTDSRYTNEAKCALSSEFEIVDAGKQHEKSIASIIKSHKINILGLEYNSILYKKYKLYEELLEGIRFIDISDRIDKLRLIKSDAEIELITNAARITDNAYAAVLNEIREGITELELSCIIQSKLIEAGAEGLAFDIICVFGENTANPHGQPSHRKLVKGDAITLDFGAKYKGYCADLTRSLFFGQPSEEYKLIYSIVNDANKAAIEALFAGITGKDADAVARKLIEKSGYSNCFLHSLGHGVGIEVHEKPYLSINSVDILDNNMVFSIEPGIYLDKLGVRIEDLVMIKDNKPMVLSHSDKKLRII